MHTECCISKQADYQFFGVKKLYPIGTGKNCLISQYSRKACVHVVVYYADMVSS